MPTYDACVLPGIRQYSQETKLIWILLKMQGKNLTNKLSWIGNKFNICWLCFFAIETT
jgi:hypothetical protein